MSFVAFPSQLQPFASPWWVVQRIMRIPARSCFAAVRCGVNLYLQEQHLIRPMTFQPTDGGQFATPQARQKRSGRPYPMRTKTAPRVDQHSVAARGCHHQATVALNSAEPAQMLEELDFPHFETKLSGQQRLQWPAKRPGERRHVWCVGWEERS